MRLTISVAESKVLVIRKDQRANIEVVKVNSRYGEIEVSGRDDKCRRRCGRRRLIRCRREFNYLVQWESLAGECDTSRNERGRYMREWRYQQ